jgi:integrase
MARQVERLTVGAVKAAGTKPDGKVKLHADGAGLYLKAELAADGVTVNRSWIYRFSVDGRERWMGLGSLNDVSLADARKLRKQMAVTRVTGQDPLAAKDAERETRRAEKAAKEAAREEADKLTLTFDAAIDLCFEAVKAKWTSLRHAAQWKRSLIVYASPVIGDVSITEIGIEAILKILRPLWQRVPESASRIRARIEMVLNYGYSSLHPDSPAQAQRLVDANPARRTSHLEFLLGQHDRTPEAFAALPYARVHEFMTALRADGSITALALELLTLTASRSSTILGARWSEVNWDEALWTIPQDRMKHRKGGDHDVPLSSRSLAILQQMEAIRSSDQIFEGVSRTAMWRLMGELAPGYSVHGLRSTFRDAAGDIFGADEIAEISLHHVTGSKTKRAYRRGRALEKRRELMDWWENFCATPYRPRAKVIELPIAKSA